MSNKRVNVIRANKDLINEPQSFPNLRSYGGKKTFKESLLLQMYFTAKKKKFPFVIELPFVKSLDIPTAVIKA